MTIFQQRSFLILYKKKKDKIGRYRFFHVRESWLWFFGWPFSKIVRDILICLYKHGISEWGLLALYGRKEILVNSSHLGSLV